MVNRFRRRDDDDDERRENDRNSDSKSRSSGGRGSDSGKSGDKEKESGGGRRFGLGGRGDDKKDAPEERRPAPTSSRGLPTPPKGDDKDKGGRFGLGRFGGGGDKDDKKDKGTDRPASRSAASSRDDDKDKGSRYGLGRLVSDKDDKKDTGTGRPPSRSSSSSAKEDDKDKGGRFGFLGRGKSEDKPSDAKPSRSPFVGGDKPDDRKSSRAPGSRAPFGDKDKDDDKPGGARPGGFGAPRPGAPGAGSSPRPGGFGSRSPIGADKDDDDDKPARPGGFGAPRPGAPGGSQSRPGGTPPRPGGFGARSPIGADKDDDDDDRPARPGGFGAPRPGAPGGSQSRPGGFGGRSPIGADKDDDDDDRPGGARPGGFGAPRPGSPGAGSSPRPGGFGSRSPIGADKDDDKPASRPGGFGAPRPSGTRPGFGDKDSDKSSGPPRSASRPSPFGTSTPSRSPSAPGARPGATPSRPEPKKEEKKESRFPFGRSKDKAESPAKSAAKQQDAKKSRAEVKAPPKKSEAAAPRSGTRAAPLPQAKDRGALTAHQGLDFDRKIDLLGLAMVAFSLITFFAVLPSMSLGILPPVQGGLTGTLDNLLSQLFGWGKIALPVAGLIVGVWLMRESFEDFHFEIDYFRLIGALMLFACALTWVHFIELFNDPAPTVAAFDKISYQTAIDQGEGGGWLGHQFYTLLLSQLGDLGTVAVMILWLVMAIMFAFELTLTEIAQIIAGVWAFFKLTPPSRPKRESENVPVLRPGESVLPVAPVAAAPVAAPAAAAPATQQLPLAPTAAVVAASVEAPEPETAPRPQPVIRRRFGNGDSGETTASPVPALPVAAAPPAVETDSEADDKPASSRRLLPRLRLSKSEPEAKAAAPAETPAAAPAPAAATPDVKPDTADTGGRGRFGSLLRRHSDEPEKPALPTPPASAPGAAAPAIAPAATSTPAASAESASEAPARRFGMFGGRPSQPPAAPTESEPAVQPVLASRPATPQVTESAANERPRSPFARPGLNEAETPVETKAEVKLDEKPLDIPAAAPASSTPGADKPELSGDFKRPTFPERPRPAFPRQPEPIKEEDKAEPDKPEVKLEEAPKPPDPVAAEQPARPIGILHTPSTPQPENSDANKPDGEEPSASAKPDTPQPAAEEPRARPAFAGGLPPRPFERRPLGAPEPEATSPTDPPTVTAAQPTAPAVAPARPVFPPRPLPNLAEDKDDEDKEDDDDLDLDLADDDADDDVEDDEDDTPERPALNMNVNAANANARPPFPHRTVPPPMPTTPPPAPATGTQPGAMTPPNRPAMPTPQRPLASPPPAQQPPAAAARPAPMPPAHQPPPAQPHPQTQTPPGQPAPRPQQTATAAAKPGAKKWQLPDFREILHKGEEQRINDEVLLDKARVIEDTLASFGAPGKVVEVNPGPVITQFGVEPDYLMGRGGKKTRVKVGSIARLDADLALALAAKTIRIEAPVPGKGFVGIEVPNDQLARVGLYDVMESPEFAKIDSKLRISLGLSVDGAPVAADMTAMPHLLIAGTTGSGKSVCVNSIISCLLLSNTPDEVQFIMVDPKRVELTGYNGIPHLVAPVVVDLERIVGVLQWVQREMEERYRKFAAIAARNIVDYNSKLTPSEKKLPYYVVVVDELADLMMLAPDETERLLARLAQMARATGIHLIISTQRPSVDIITGLIKANFPARIAFAVASSVDSRVILDQPGAEKLLGRGDMLFQSPDAAAPLRLQGVFVSDEEINRITRYWKNVGLEGTTDVTPANREINFTATQGTMSRPAVPARKPESPQAAFWDEVGSVTVSMDDDTGENDGMNEDELYEQAVELVTRLKKASISLLQRRLRIGYTRAARLIDKMELDGIVGPAESGSKPREVLKG